MTSFSTILERDQQELNILEIKHDKKYIELQVTRFWNNAHMQHVTQMNRVKLCRKIPITYQGDTVSKGAHMHKVQSLSQRVSKDGRSASWMDRDSENLRKVGASLRSIKEENTAKI